MDFLCPSHINIINCAGVLDALQTSFATATNAGICHAILQKLANCRKPAATKVDSVVKVNSATKFVVEGTEQVD